MNLSFNECAIVFTAWRWTVPFFCFITQLIGIQRMLWLFSFVPPRSGRPGLCCLGKEGVYFSPDQTYCLLMRKEWECWTVFKALTELQRTHWHGITIPIS